VVENLSPGALARQGMGWPQLSAINPRLVYLSMAAAGQDGPAAGMRAYAPIMSSFCGFEALVGYADEEAIGMMNFGLGDPNAAIHALVPLLAAIDIARRTGRGQHIDMAQIEAILSVSAEPITDWFMNRRQARPQGNRHPEIAPHGIFPALGDDRWVSIAAPDDQAWQSLVACMGSPDWASVEAYRTAAGRLAQVASIEDRLAQWTSTRERDWLVSSLRAAGLACSPVQDVREQWQDRQWFIRSAAPSSSTVRPG
jgi:crotonobetainyl-CoA:carnitine CoA-transferase CaiB-like acyl-CoA transferase